VVLVLAGIVSAGCGSGGDDESDLPDEPCPALAAPAVGEPISLTTPENTLELLNGDIDRDGRLVLLGDAVVDGYEVAFVARSTSDGRQDFGFGYYGILYVAVPGYSVGGADDIGKLAAAPAPNDGLYVAAALTEPPIGVAVFETPPEGQDLERSFGENGFTTLDLHEEAAFMRRVDVAISGGWLYVFAEVVRFGEGELATIVRRFDLGGDLDDYRLDLPGGLVAARGLGDVLAVHTGAAIYRLVNGERDLAWGDEGVVAVPDSAAHAPRRDGSILVATGDELRELTADGASGIAPLAEIPGLLEVVERCDERIVVARESGLANSVAAQVLDATGAPVPDRSVESVLPPGWGDWTVVRVLDPLRGRLYYARVGNGFELETFVLQP
jgi:hypothetical protein